MDQEETYGPIRQQDWTIGLIVGLLLLATMLGVGLLWRQQKLAFARREWAEHMKAHGLTIEIDADANLLKDAVHQSEYGKLIINENIARHFARPVRFGYDPDRRERRVLHRRR